MPLEMLGYWAAGRALNEYLQERNDLRSEAHVLQEQSRTSSLKTQAGRRQSRSHKLRRSKVRLLRLFG